MTIESLQDTATYDSKQKNMGFSADIALKGVGSSLSVNGGKTNLNSDYKAVGEQSGIFANEADLITQGKGTFKGGVFVTSEEAQTNGKSNIVFKQGVTATDLKNTTSYDGDAIQAGISIGSTNNKPQASMNGIGYGKDSDSDSSITKGGVSGYNDPDGNLTTDNRVALAGKLESVFDAEKVNEGLAAQTEITQAFDQERRKFKTDINAKEKKLRDEAEEASNAGDYQAAREKFDAADKLVNQGLLFDAVAGAIYGPNSNGAMGYVAKAVSPAVSFKVGQYYKELEANQDNKLTGGQQASHILAHTLLGAAVSYATGNDVLTGGVSAGTGEAAAPLLSQLLYEKDTDKLTAEQKDTISSIVSALGAGIGATTGNASDAANAAETSKVAAENNDGGPQTYGQSKAELMKETWEMNNGPVGKLLNKNQKYILIGTDFIPIVGDIKGYSEAETVGDYLFASISLVPVIGDAAKVAYNAAKAKKNVQGMINAIQQATNNIGNKAQLVQGNYIINKIEDGVNVKPVINANFGKGNTSLATNEVRKGTGIKYDVEITERGGDKQTIDIGSKQRIDKNGDIVNRRSTLSFLYSTFSKKEGELYIQNMAAGQAGYNIGREMIDEAINAVGKSNVKTVRAELAYDNQIAFNAAFKKGGNAVSSVDSTPLGKSMNALGFKVKSVTPTGGFPKVIFERK